MTRPQLPTRIAVAQGVALACAVIPAFDSIAKPDAVPDFDRLWFAATAVLDGRDPHQLIGHRPRLETALARLPQWIRGEPGAVGEPVTMDDVPMARGHAELVTGP